MTGFQRVVEGKQCRLGKVRKYELKDLAMKMLGEQVKRELGAPYNSRDS
jgi:hypothetical protein